jgi:hypothetical protein
MLFYKVCDNNCLTCSVSVSNCNSCRGNKENAPLCSCPLGTYEDGVNINC